MVRRSAFASFASLASVVRLATVGATAAVSAAAGGCEPTNQLPDSNLSVQLPDGTNPLTGRALTNARAYFRQDVPGALEDWVDAPVADGTFDLTIPIASYSTPVELRIELQSLAGVELVGGTPSYYLGESTSLRVLVGEPGTCAVVTTETSPPARNAMGAALLGSFVLLSGGKGASDADAASIDAVDLLTYDRYTLTDAITPLGATRAAPVDRVRAIVVSTLRAPYVHRLFASDITSGRPEPTLHAGAESADAVIAAPGTGALVVGGGSDAAPSAHASWVLSPASADASERVVDVTLASAVPHRAATFADNGAWVVSSDGASTRLEQIPALATASTIRIDVIADGVRRGANVVFDATGSTGILFGGVDDTDAVRTDTLVFTGCPETCVAAPGPTWDTARVGIALEPTGQIVGGFPASDRVERVRFAAAGPVIEPLATLTAPRAFPSTVHLPSGVVVVVGGADLAGPRADIELCFPSP